jgi:hypothetical protein
MLLIAARTLLDRQKYLITVFLRDRFVMSLYCRHFTIWSRGLLLKSWVLIRIFVILGINMSGDLDIMEISGSVSRQISGFDDIFVVGAFDGFGG